MNHDARWLGSPMQSPPYEQRTSRHRSTRSDASRHLGIPNTPLSGYPISPRSPNAAPWVPMLRPVRSSADLMPRTRNPGKFRRVLPDGSYLSPLNAITTQIATTFKICDPSVNCTVERKPLTKPSVGEYNNGHDNSESDYILCENDLLGTDENRRYMVLGLLGKGTFGQVAKCQNLATREIVAVKVIKNKPAYLNQSMMEVSILEHIQQHVTKKDQYNLLQLKDKFVHKEHLCLVFELLGINLYEVIAKNQFRGLGIRKVRTYSLQILEAMAILKDAKLVHCDLKPENILLRPKSNSEGIKVIDFGSACHERQSVYTYIQSRFYRSPEVILGLPYTSSIDMWSLGCIVAELFLGLPIFPGTGEYNQWYRIVEMLGPPPKWMLDMGKNTNQFMKQYVDAYGQKWYRLRTIEEQVAEFNTDEKPMKRYFNSTDLREIVMSYPILRQDMSQHEIDLEMQQRECLVDFIKGLLNLNPFERWTPRQALSHPFMTGNPFVGPFTPMPERVAQEPVPVVPAVPAVPELPEVPIVQMPIPPVPAQPVPSGPTHFHNTITPKLQPMVPTLTTQGQPAPQYGYQPRRRMRSATINQPEPIPRQLQQAAAMVVPGDAIAAQPSPAYVPPPELYKK